MKECGRLYCINRADYGHGGSLEVGLCKLNRQTQRRQLQEWTETASGADGDNEEHVETRRLTGRDCNSI
jgi:hypothetical protein